MDDMKPKKIIYSTFILFVFMVFAGCSSTVDQQNAGNPLFPERHGWDLKQVAISDTDNTSLDFKRVNCVWVIGNDNKPSDESRVTALADKCGVLLTLDRADFHNKLGDQVYGMLIRTPGEWLAQVLH